MKSLRLTFLLTMFALVPAAAQAAPPDIPPGHDRYIVVLKTGAAEPDVRQFGGTLKGKSFGVLYISLPPQALEQLRQHDSVKYVQHAILGPSASPAAARGSGLSKAVESLDGHTTVAPPTWTSGDYVYDGAGNIAQVGTTGSPGNDNKQTLYLYDEASRLTEAQIGRLGGDRTETYTYDQYGNMVTKSVNGTAVGLGATSTATNRMNLWTYDEVGNVNGVVGDPGSVYGYDPMNMMIEKDWGYGISQELYVYTPSDERLGVYSRGSDQWNWTLRDFSGKPIRQYSSTSENWWTWTEDYAWMDGRMLGAERQPEEGGRRHFHLDHLGSPRLITGYTGQRISLHDYAPFGEELGSIQQERGEHHDREEPLKFTGHERDYLPITGENTRYFDYMHARYYSPVAGRFLSPDPVLGDPKRPQSWNRYAYVENNPLNRTDPTGKCGESADFVGPRKPCLEVAKEMVDKAAMNVVKPALTVMVGLMNDSPKQVAKGTAGLVASALVTGKAGQLARLLYTVATTTKVYRVVDSNEKLDIQRTGQFRPSPNGTTHKGFFFESKDAADLGNRLKALDGQQYDVVSGRAPNSVISDSPPHIAAGEGPGRLVPNEKLPQIEPTDPP